MGPCGTWLEARSELWGGRRQTAVLIVVYRKTEVSIEHKLGRMLSVCL